MTISAPLIRLQRHITDIHRADLALARASTARVMRPADRAISRLGLYVLATRHFERFLEDQLIEIASGKHRWKGRVIDGQLKTVRSRLAGTSRPTIEALTTMNRDYFDPLPWSRGIEPAARTMLYGGHPFTLISEADVRTIGRVSRVRNCIAHDSESARKQMEKALSNIAGLGRRERRVPIRYLDHMFSATVDYFTQDLRNLLRIAAFLS